MSFSPCIFTSSPAPSPGGEGVYLNDYLFLSPSPLGEGLG